jgi:hypothetical protein
MALSKEMILTLQQLKGIGNKTIFKICESEKSSITDIDEVYNATGGFDIREYLGFGNK